MARIAGVDLPRDKRVEYGLTYIYGIGLATSQKILSETGINPDTTVSIVDGTVTFTTTHFSTYDIAQEALAEPAERTYTLVTSETELVSGDQYLLIYNGTKFVLPEIVTRSNDSGEQRHGKGGESRDGGQ